MQHKNPISKLTLVAFGLMLSGYLTAGSHKGIDTTAHTSPNFPSPFIAFSAECNNFSADLEWVTVTESNCDHFTVEKTEDGIHFEIVGVLKGAGNNSSHDYKLTDYTPYIGFSYYRLSETDNDGKTTVLQNEVYEPCVASEFASAFTANGNINTQIQSYAADTYTITLINAVGQTVMRLSKNVSEGLNIYKIPANYPPGVYQLCITNSSRFYTHKLVL